MAGRRIAGGRRSLSMPMSNERPICEDTIRQLDAWLDRELDSATSAAMARHVAVCPACGTRAGFEKRLRAQVRAAGTQAPPDRLYHRIRNILDTI